MIAGVECCQDVRRTVRVACSCVEVDHTVKRAAAADPLVDGLTLLLLFRFVEALEVIRPALLYSPNPLLLRSESFVGSLKKLLSPPHGPLGRNFSSFSFPVLRNRQTDTRGSAPAQFRFPS